MDSSWFLDVNGFARRTAFLHGFARSGATAACLAVLAACSLAAFLRARAARGPSGPRRVGAVLLVVPVTAAACALVEPVARAVGRARPGASLPGVEVLVAHQQGPSLPALSGALAGAAAAALWCSRDRAAAGIATLAAVVLAASRVYAGVHYPLDELAGIGLGVTVALLAHALLARPSEHLVELLRAGPLSRIVRTAPPEPLAGPGPAARAPEVVATGSVRLLDGGRPAAPSSGLQAGPDRALS